MSTTTATRPTGSSQPTAPARLDMYVGIHKALRHFMTDTLHRVGRYFDVGR